MKRLWLLCLCLPTIAFSQKLLFAKTFDKQGNLIGQDSVFHYQGRELILAVKAIMPTTIPSETLYVIVKDFEKVVGRYYMKRSKHYPNQANALIRIKKAGIYRVFVFNPQQRRHPMVKGYVFITDDLRPDVKSLIDYQLRMLVKKGIIPPPKKTLAANQNPSWDEENAMDSLEDLESMLEDEDTEDLDALSDALAEIEDIDIEDLDLVEKEIQRFNGGVSESDFEGEFESFDELDDQFDFEISDF